MHELGITTEMIEGIRTRLAQVEGSWRVSRVVVEIGELTAVLPESIRFCFEICARGTPIEGAELDIIEIPARGICASCHRELREALVCGICPCGNAEIRWESGTELKIKQLELT